MPAAFKLLQCNALPFRVISVDTKFGANVAGFVDVYSTKELIHQQRSILERGEAIHLSSKVEER